MRRRIANVRNVARCSGLTIRGLRAWYRSVLHHIFSPEVAETAHAVFLKDAYPAAYTILSIDALQARYDFVYRDVVVPSRVLDALHVLSTVEANVC